MSHSEQQNDKTDNHQRTFSAAKRLGGDSSHGGRNPFNGVAPLTPGGLASPTTGGSSAFGLGSGAFASFGSAAKTPKTPGTAFDFKSGTPTTTSTTRPTTPADKKDRPAGKIVNSARKESVSTSIPEDMMSASGELDLKMPWPLKCTWVVWFRPPTPKSSDYEKSIQPVFKFSTAQEFWKVFAHLKRPSSLPTVSDYNVFKHGIRPVWEDEENKKGGKWIMRLKKGVADRYWEELLMALVGDQFMDAGEGVCGMVLSVRSGEDVFSIWTKDDGQRNIKIRCVLTRSVITILLLTVSRDTVKRVLNLPDGTNIVWRSHDESIAQRTYIDQSRHEKNHQGHEKRKMTLVDESQRDKPSTGS
jgi:translation initiation factor 4E